MLSRSDPGFDDLLRFEAEHTGSTPRGWYSGVKDWGLDKDTVHGGKWSVRIRRDANSAYAFTFVGATIPVDFEGKEAVLRGFLKPQDVTGFAAFYLRLDSEQRESLAFDSLQRQSIRGKSRKRARR